MWSNALAELDSHHKDWCDHNFPTRTAFHALTGIVEEAGEFAAASNADEKYDALADMFLFLLDYCRLAEISTWLPDDFNKVDYECRLYWDESKYPLDHRGLLALVGKLSHSHLKHDRSIRGVTGLDLWLVVAALVGWLFMCARSMGQDLEALVQEAWSFVRLRDWKRFPKDGVSQ